MEEYLAVIAAYYADTVHAAHPDMRPRTLCGRRWNLVHEDWWDEVSRRDKCKSCLIVIEADDTPDPTQVDPYGDE